MSDTPANSGPTRHKGSLACACRFLPTIGIGVAAGWMAVSLLFLASSQFSSREVDLPAGLSGSLFAHLFLFGMLGFLTVVGALVIRRSERLFVAMVAALLVGGAWALGTEWYQSTVSDRSASLEDLVANVIGTAAGALLAWMVRRRVARMSRFLCAGHSRS